MEQKYYDPILEENLKAMEGFISRNFDVVGVVDGMEGSGKSELSKQLCMYIDPTFSAEDVVYTPEQFKEWLENAPVGKACLWDEFVLAGLSTDAMSKMQKEIMQNFTMIRKKRLFIVLVIPYFFMLRKYFAISRPRFLIHVYTKGYERGYFKFYNYTQKKFIYNSGHKTWVYPAKIKPAFEGKFKNWTEGYIDEEIIQQRKDEAINKLNKPDEEEKGGVRLKMYRNAFKHSISLLRRTGMSRAELTKEMLQFMTADNVTTLWEEVNNDRNYN